MISLRSRSASHISLDGAIDRDSPEPSSAPGAAAAVLPLDTKFVKRVKTDSGGAYYVPHPRCFKR